jgi:hypothetical protein
MNNNCINLKQGFGKLKCTKLKKEITWSDCKNCEFKEYKKVEYKPIKQRTYKQAKMEKDRFSILTKDLKHCYICKKPKEDLHEIYIGSKRRTSIRYGLVLPLCRLHHSEMHNNSEMYLKWLKKGQLVFMKHYNKTADEFREIFGKNYL